MTLSPNLSSAAPMGLQGWDLRSPTDDLWSSTKLVVEGEALLPNFAHLPNGIIREIISYTGATYKKRNGKYMGQILKSDIRYKLLLKIPRNVVLNMGYILDVNKNLTIRIIIYHFSTTIVDYEYYFKDGKTPIYYRPK